MHSVVELLRARPWPRAAVLVLMTVGVAACSADSTRFNDNQYAANPYATANPNETTGAVAAAPGGRIESRPLTTAVRQPHGTAVSGTAGGGHGMASYNPANPAPQTRVASRPAPEITGTVAAPRHSPAGHWTWDGGTPVTVAAGDTVETLAHRYGVPASVIAQSNNVAPPGTIYPGQHLVIPRYVSSTVVASAGPLPARVPMVAAPAPVPAAPVIASRVSGHQAVHVVARGETLSRISRLYGKSVNELARANRLSPDARLKVGDRLVIPGIRTSKATPKAKAGPVVAEAKPAPHAAPKEEEAKESVSMVAPVPAQAFSPAKAAEATGALPSFRWPAHGRVIAGYGPTPNGVQNDGINIALPVGTPVKAAEDGVVAYAGNELKGYGNLVLIRHPNGYVTAYAHAKEITVRRGDHIKRGQVIAHSGQSGNVNAPQLHFEIRKGATPLDPKRYLGGG
jgi:murein DD-endopeptidase MepM/ murein hydrolase activator NlpD